MHDYLSIFSLLIYLCILQEIKQIKESITKSFDNELIELRDLIDTKQKELAQVNRVLAEQKHSIDDLGERLSTSLQSLCEANEIIKR